MSEIRDNIFGQINDEREYQDKKWGTQFDDKNTVNDWGAYIGIYLAKATDMSAGNGEQYKALVKVAALAIAALETMDRNGQFPPRHYDIRLTPENKALTTKVA